MLTRILKYSILIILIIFIALKTNTIQILLMFIIMITAWIMLMNNSIKTMINVFTIQTFMIGVYFLVFTLEPGLVNKLEQGNVNNLRLSHIIFSFFFILFASIIRMVSWPKLLKKISTIKTERLLYGKISLSKRLVLIGALSIILSLVFSKLPVFLGDQKIHLILGLNVILIGIFVMTTRNDLMSQAIGILGAENGLYISGFFITSNVHNDVNYKFLVAVMTFALLTFFAIYFLLDYAHKIDKTLNVDSFSKLRG